MTGKGFAGCFAALAALTVIGAGFVGVGHGGPLSNPSHEPDKTVFYVLLSGMLLALAVRAFIDADQEESGR